MNGALTDGPSRQRLPNRRLIISQSLPWQGNRWLLGVGWDVEGRVREIFLDGPKIGSDAEAMLGAAAMLISARLQEGATAAELGRWLGGKGNPAGALALLAAEMEAELGARVVAYYEYAAPYLKPWPAGTPKPK